MAMKRLRLLLLLLLAHLDKEHPIAEAKTKLVKELDVFQQIVVAGTSVAVLVVVPRFDIIKNLHLFHPLIKNQLWNSF